MSRPSKEQTFMDIAEVWSRQSTCSAKIAVGAVLVNGHQQVIASGFNGAPRGLPHCDQVGCDDDGHHHRVIHAEENALLQCAYIGVSSVNTIMYVTHEPCYRCALRIIQAGIKRVVFKYSYGDSTRAIVTLHMAGVEVSRLEEQ